MSELVKDIMGWKCRYYGCKTRATFNIANEKYPVYCKTHKIDGMVNVTKVICEYKDCMTTPIFNYRGDKHGKYCSKHKESNMIDIFSKGCREDDCDIAYPMYNYSGEKYGIYCKIHKKDGMVDVKNKKCEIEDCNVQPKFNYKTEKRGRFCELHKYDEMVNVVSKEKCCFENCLTRPSYNFINETKPLYCKIHKHENMIDIISNRCREQDCDKHPCFNEIGMKYGIYCVTHKKDGMINVTGIRCKNTGCDTIPYYYSKSRGYCLFCFTHLFPDESIVFNLKVKEKHVTDYIKSEFPNWTIITDKKVVDGCSNRRPDSIIDFGNFVMIIEIDEYQHSTYETICENKRTMELSQDVGHRPMVIIRFNPDKYISKSNVLVKSCWELNRFGLQVISKHYKQEWEYRLLTLKNTILRESKKNHEKTVEILYLFYNGYDDYY